MPIKTNQEKATEDTHQRIKKKVKKGNSRKCENREINDQNRFLKPVSSADNTIVGILRQIEGRFAKCDRRFDDEVSDEGASFRASNLRQMCF